MSRRLHKMRRWLGDEKTKKEIPPVYRKSTYNLKLRWWDPLWIFIHQRHERKHPRRYHKKYYMYRKTPSKLLLASEQAFSVTLLVSQVMQSINKYTEFAESITTPSNFLLHFQLSETSCALRFLHFLRQQNWKWLFFWRFSMGCVSAFLLSGICRRFGMPQFSTT